MFDFEFHEYQGMIVDLLQSTKVGIFFLFHIKNTIFLFLPFKNILI